jgi:hypothetical protein
LALAAAGVLGAALPPRAIVAQSSGTITGNTTGADRWDWTGSIETGRQLYVRNLNGPIRVEASSGNTVEVSAYKRAGRRGNVRDVTITVEQRSSRGDVVICARWNDRTDCDESGYRSRGNGNNNEWWRFGNNNSNNNTNNVDVEFVVRLPKGVRVTASTVNGGLEIEGEDSEVTANTVNGSVIARSNGGPVRTVSDPFTVWARTAMLGTGTLDYETVNGQITLEIPENSSADVELRTVNGSISTDFPLTIDGKFSSRRVRGTIGKGGQLLRLETVNGSIRLRRA